MAVKSLVWSAAPAREALGSKLWPIRSRFSTTARSRLNFNKRSGPKKFRWMGKWNQWLWFKSHFFCIYSWINGLTIMAISAYLVIVGYVTKQPKGHHYLSLKVCLSCYIAVKPIQLGWITKYKRDWERSTDVWVWLDHHHMMRGWGFSPTPLRLKAPGRKLSEGGKMRANAQILTLGGCTEGRAWLAR